VKFYVSTAFLDTAITPLVDAFTPGHYERAEAGGVTGIITSMFHAGASATLSEKVDGMKRFRKDMRLDG
jgi:hypothetical protein